MLVSASEVQGWDKGARPWIKLHGEHPAESSGRYVLIPTDGCAEPFGTAAIATFQVGTPWIPYQVTFERVHGAWQRQQWDC